MDKSFMPTAKPKYTPEQIRKVRLLSARALADKSGVAAPTINRIEAGATPRYDTIARLSEALGVRPDEIIWPGDPLGLNDFPGIKEASEE